MSLELGKYNRLKIVKAVDFGFYLDGDDGVEILLPKRYVPQDAAAGEEIEVFVYKDNEERLIATTDKPFGTVGEFCLMKVREVSKVGAFLDWGIMKDLLVPYREQKSPMIAGESYLVYIYLDFVTRRVAASTRLERYLDNIPPSYEYNQEVELIIAGKTDLGYKLIINNTHSGLLFSNQAFGKLEVGDRRKGYIKEVREDDKIDISLFPLGYEKVDIITQKILDELDAGNGFMPVGDKTDAATIYSIFGCSKKGFKMTLGALYRQRMIVIEDDGVRLIKL
jgi:predicted RNA-binding protein (virulence factor B family)